MLGEPDGEELEKYSAISAAIFSELADSQGSGGGWNDAVNLFDSSGRPITDSYVIDGAQRGNGKTGGLTGALRSFVAALNWLASRSIYYSFVARHLEADTFLHLIRTAFQLHYMAKTGSSGSILSMK